MTNRIKVLIVDDSALIRVLLTKTLSQSPNIEIVGTAEDPLVAWEMIKQFSPDVLTLDIEMPKMDGLTFLKNLMRLKPMPVVMIATLTKRGADATLKALEYGAVDFIEKPVSDIRENINAYGSILIEKVLAAATCKVASSQAASHEVIKKVIKPLIDKRGNVKVITIGASTGGTEAIRTVIQSLPNTLPPIVMAQHIPPIFSTSFAKRLNDTSEITVLEPTGEMELKAGHAYLAPGDDHLKLVTVGNKLYLTIARTSPVNRHRPSVDVLYNSVHKTCGKDSIAVLLTGMGSDGAKGLKLLYDSGAHTIAQDEASSIVWGMPGTAVSLGGASEVLALNKIADRLVNLVYSN